MEYLCFKGYCCFAEKTLGNEFLKREREVRVILDLEARKLMVSFSQGWTRAEEQKRGSKIMDVEGLPGESSRELVKMTG